MRKSEREKSVIKNETERRNEFSKCPSTIEEHDRFIRIQTNERCNVACERSIQVCMRNQSTNFFFKMRLWTERIIEIESRDNHIIESQRKTNEYMYIFCLIFTLSRANFFISRLHSTLSAVFI